MKKKNELWIKGMMNSLSKSEFPDEPIEAIEDYIDVEAARAALKEKGGMSLSEVRKKLGLSIPPTGLKQK